MAEIFSENPGVVSTVRLNPDKEKGSQLLEELQENWDVEEHRINWDGTITYAIT